MKDLMIDRFGDIRLGDFDFSLIEDRNEITQSVRIILETRLGEFELDKTLGLGRENLLGKNPNLNYLSQDITTAILEQESRIVTIESLEFMVDKDARGLTVKIQMIGKENTQIEMEVTTSA